MEQKVAELERLCGKLALENEILKKGLWPGTARAKARHEFEEAKEEHPGMPLSDLCELFGVSRSWYYERPGPDKKAAEDVELGDAIERIVSEFPGYG